jgi:hypothetical protein
MATYTLISSNVLSSSAASVTFSSIPATYTDLVLRTSTRDDRADTQNAIRMRINGNTSTVYSLTRIFGDGTNPSSQRLSNQDFSQIYYENSANTTANTFTNGEFYFPNYLASQNKPISAFMAQERNLTEAFIANSAILFSSTAVITSLSFEPASSSFVSGSSFYLYGISNA